MIELFLLEQLVAFAKCGTLSKAAEELHITQPALSRSMKKLEAAFGVPLFDRAKSKISLNETGKIAAQYAERVLQADQELVERTLQFDRSMRTLAVGSCAFLPFRMLLPLLQEHFNEKAITSEVASNGQLLAGLKNRVYQLAILYEQPEDESIFCQRYIDENLCITVPAGHALACRKTLSFADLAGMSILAHGSSGFWLERCRQNLQETKLLVQDSMDALHELVDASILPTFSSDRAAEYGYRSDDRVSIPLSDRSAHTTYYLACLHSEKAKYRAIFQAARASAGP